MNNPILNSMEQHFRELDQIRAKGAATMNQLNQSFNNTPVYSPPSNPPFNGNVIHPPVNPMNIKFGICDFLSRGNTDAAVSQQK